MNALRDCLLLLLLTSFSGCSGCGGDVKEVTATCTHAERYHSDLGTVNVPAYGLGKIMMLSGPDQDKRVIGIGRVAVADADQKKDPVVDHMTVALESTFDLSFDADIPAATRTKAEASLTRNVVADLENVRRVDLVDPVALVRKASTDIRDAIKNASGDPSTQFVIVSSIKGAEKLDLKLSNNAGTTVEGNVVTYGDVKLKVNYKCEKMVKIASKTSETGVFYGVTPLTYDAKTDTIVIGTGRVEMWKADHTNAFTDAP